MEILYNESTPGKQKTLYLMIKDWSDRTYECNDLVMIPKDSKLNELKLLVKELGYNSIQVLFDWKKVFHDTTEVWELFDTITNKTGIKQVYAPDIEYKPHYL